MNATNFYAPAIIPNTVGYRVMVFLKGGGAHETVVERGDNGLHRLRGVHISDVRCWAPAKDFLRFS